MCCQRCWWGADTRGRSLCDGVTAPHWRVTATEGGADPKTSLGLCERCNHRTIQFAKFRRGMMMVAAWAGTTFGIESTPLPCAALTDALLSEDALPSPAARLGRAPDFRTEPVFRRSFACRFRPERMRQQGLSSPGVLEPDTCDNKASAPQGC